MFLGLHIFGTLQGLLMLVQPIWIYYSFQLPFQGPNKEQGTIAQAGSALAFQDQAIGLCITPAQSHTLGSDSKVLHHLLPVPHAGIRLWGTHSSPAQPSMWRSGSGALCCLPQFYTWGLGPRSSTSSPPGPACLDWVLGALCHLCLVLRARIRLQGPTPLLCTGIGPCTALHAKPNTQGHGQWGPPEIQKEPCGPDDKVPRARSGPQAGSWTHLLCGVAR